MSSDVALQDHDQSTLVVPVPAAEPAVAMWRNRHDPAARAGIPAHVTILIPFLPPHTITAGEEERLAHLFASFKAFRFHLRDVRRFPGALYLAPEPADRFVQLTSAVWSAWPMCPPYGGRFADIVPHLTVADHVGDDVLDTVERAIAAAVPIEAYASELSLMVQQQGRWRVRRTFALGA